MVNRRKALSILASLPIAGNFFYPSIAMSAVSDVKLKALKDMLMPGLWAIGRNDVILDIDIDWTSRALIVSGHKYKNENKMLGFAVTENSIRDGLYTETFGPCCEELVRRLREE